MSAIVLVLIVFGGVAVLFALGALITNKTKIGNEYRRMLNKGGNIPVNNR